MLGHWFDALKNVGHPDALGTKTKRWSPAAIRSCRSSRAGAPVYGLESYVRVGARGFPVSFRALIEQPSTLVRIRGIRGSLPGADSRVRVQARPRTRTVHYVSLPSDCSYYTSRAVVRATRLRSGHRIGNRSGSSSQWFATDYFQRAGSGDHAGTDAIHMTHVSSPVSSAYVEPARTTSHVPGFRGGYAIVLQFRVDYAHANRSTRSSRIGECTTAGENDRR